MTLSRERRIDQVFDRALDVDPEDRAEFLDRACADDADLRAEVVGLLSAHEDMGGFLQDSAAHRVEQLLGEKAVRLEPGARVGGYEILGLLGAGSAGAVYEARQTRPRRKVALKVMASGLASPQALARFAEEAEILARLDHPHIAHVYEAGVHVARGRDVPFFALEYVDGARTVVAHAQHAGLGTRKRLELVALICDAVHHGHQKGVVHRDLKPANLLVGSEGQPKVIDFGVARVEGLGAERRGIVGTLQYMSPEQCRAGGAGVDVRSDVYALGVILYELLSGHVPYEVGDATVAEALRIVQDRTPTPLREVAPRLPADLVAIVHRALAKNAAERYVSAAALADDIRRFLGDQPVEAARGGALYQLAKFARRRRLAFLALTAVILVSVVAAVIGSTLAYQKERERERTAFQAYVANLAAAASALRVNDVGDARQRLEAVPPAQRGWEWRHLHGRLDTSASTLTWEDGRLRTGAVSPGGAYVAASAEHLPNRVTSAVRVWEYDTGAVLHSFELGARPDSLAFSPDETLLAVGGHDGSLELRDARSGELVRRLAGHVDPERRMAERHVNALVFADAGRLLASASGDATIRVWDVRSGDHVRTLVGHPDRVIALALHPDGERLVSGGRAGDVRVWNIATGRELRSIDAHASSVEGVAVSPDGTRLVTASRDETVALWNLETGESLASRSKHTNNVRSVAFAPDGETFASASWDRTVRIWRAHDGEELATLRGHRGAVTAVTFHPDGDRLVSFSRAGTVKTWPGSPRRHDTALRGHADRVQAVAFSPDGTQVVSVSSERERAVRVWDVVERTCTQTLENEIPPPLRVAFTPGGSHLLRSGHGSPLRVWTLPVVEAPRDHDAIAWLVSLGPHGRNMYTPLGEDRVGVWDTSDWSLRSQWRTGEKTTVRVVPGPRGEFIAVGSANGDVSLWRSEDSTRVGHWQQEGQLVHEISFRPDGRRLAVAVRASSDVYVLQTPSLQQVATLRGHTGYVRAAVYAPGGGRLATGGEDGTVRIWGAERNEQLVVLHGHRNAVLALAWSRDGSRLVSAGGTPEEPGELLLWEAPSE